MTPSAARPAIVLPPPPSCQQAQPKELLPAGNLRARRRGPRSSGAAGRPWASTSGWLTSRNPSAARAGMRRSGDPLVTNDGDWSPERSRRTSCRKTPFLRSFAFAFGTMAGQRVLPPPSRRGRAGAGVLADGDLPSFRPFHHPKARGTSCPQATFVPVVIPMKEGPFAQKQPFALRHGDIPSSRYPERSRMITCRAAPFAFAQRQPPCSLLPELGERLELRAFASGSESR